MILFRYSCAVQNLTLCGKASEVKRWQHVGSGPYVIVVQGFYIYSFQLHIYRTKRALQVVILSRHYLPLAGIG